MKISSLAPLFAAVLVVLASPFAQAAHAKTNPAPAAKLDHHTSTAELAARGDAEAQYQMGETLLNKAKTPAAREQALVWFTLAGSNGNILAAIAAAKTFETVGKPTQSAQWWYRAGQLGDTAARHHFMELFLKDQSIGIGGRDGVNWLAERALTSHDSTIKLALGNAFAQGLGVVPSTGEAVRWYMDAAMDDNVEAMTRLGQLDLQRPAAWRIPDKELDKDGHWSGPKYQPIRPMARDTYNIPDDGKQTIAQETNTDPDHLIFSRPGMADGEYWLHRASRWGLPGAKTAWGLAQLDGLTLPLDQTKGVWLLTSAACSFDHTALLALSRYWDMKNPVKAWTFAEIAAQAGQNVPQNWWDHLIKTTTPHQMAKAKALAQDWCSQN